MDVEDHAQKRQPGGYDQTSDFMDWFNSTGAYGTLENPGLSASVDNWFTGSLDYKRNLELQKQAQEFNAREAEKEYERTKALRASAYQDSVKDQMAAGLNPYISYALGSGGAAATPGLQSAHSSANSYHNSALGLKDILTVLASVFGSAFSVGVGAANASKRVAAYNFATKTKEKIASKRLAFDMDKFEYFVSQNERRRR